MNTLVAATKIQAAFRGYAERKKLNEKNKAATTIQKNYRGHKTRQEIEEKDKAARVIQGNYRSYQEKKKDRPWWKRLCDKCGKVSKKISGVFHKEPRRPARSPSTLKKDEEDYKPPLKNPYDENPTPVEEYKVPEGKTLTLLQLSKIYDKKQEQNSEEDKPLKLPPPRLVAGIDAVEGSSGAYQQPKPHKVIKYHPPTPPESPQKPEPPVENKPVVEEEGNFFTRLFKPLEIKPAEKKPEEKKPEEKKREETKPEQPNAGEEFFGKFKGLFTREEKPMAQDVVPLVPSGQKGEVQEEEEEVDGDEEEVDGDEEDEEEEEVKPQPQVEEKVDILARFQNRFKTEYNIAPARATVKTTEKVEPKQEVNEVHVEEEGTFSKFTGLFKSENKETSDADKDEENTFSSKFTGLFKKDESDNKQTDSTREENGNIVTKDNQEEGSFFGKLFKKDEEKPAEVKKENAPDESGIDKMFSIFKKK